MQRTDMGGKSHPVQQSSPSISFQAAIFIIYFIINVATSPQLTLLFIESPQGTLSAPFCIYSKQHHSLLKSYLTAK